MTSRIGIIGLAALVLAACLGPRANPHASPSIRAAVSPRIEPGQLVSAALPQPSMAAQDSWQAPPRNDRNSSFWARLDNPPPDPLQPPLSWYAPKAILQGAPGPFLKSASSRTRIFNPQTVQMATSFADLTTSKALLVAHNGILEIEHYGATDSGDHVFSAHSMTRVLGAVAIGILVDRGIIKSIDMPASDYVAEWRNDARRVITIRQLLTMSSGIRTSFSTAPGSPYMQGYYGADIENTVAEAPLVFEPGKTFNYDLYNNHALALIVERASGQSYQDFVSRAIWRKIGADDAQMMLDRAGGRVTSYCCLISTPRNWLRVGEMLRQNGVWQHRRIVSADWVRQMRTPSAANPNFGFQVFLGSAWRDERINRDASKQKDTLESVNSSSAFYFSGAGDVHVMVLPDRGLTIVRTGAGSKAWRYHFIPNLLVDALGFAPLNGEWDTLYLYRLSLPKPKSATLLDSGLSYWPLARLPGAQTRVPLPRAPFACDVSGQFQAIDDRLDKGGSYAFLVYQAGAIRHEHVAGTFSAATLGESASMHKSVMALLVGRALEDHKIASLDIPISTWLSEWAGDPRGLITLRNLLQMASGLKPVPFEPAIVGGKSNLLLYGSHLDQLVLSLDYKEKPGTTFEYFGHVSELIALILQRATGEPYADYLQRVLWGPMGGHDAFITLDRPGGMARTYASLLAIPEDWIRIGRIFLRSGAADGGRIVSPEWIRQMTAPSAANPNYGFQIWRGEPYQPQRAYSTSNPVFTVKAAEPFLATDMTYFDGAVGRRVYVSKAEDLVIVRLGDADSSWEDSWLPNAVVRAIRFCHQR